MSSEIYRSHPLSRYESVQKSGPSAEESVGFYTDFLQKNQCLHYFRERTTFEVLEEIKRVLKPDGILLFRVNSVKDVNHGAGEGKEIEPHLYETSDGRYKRFFNQEDIERFFEDWEALFIHEEIMGRYKKEKVLWRCAMKVRK